MMWVSRQMLKLEKQMSAVIGKRVLSLNHYLAIHGDPIRYDKDLQALNAVLQKRICADCIRWALKMVGSWVVGCVPSKSNPNLVHLSDPVCENWRLWFGKPLCWQRSDQDTTHGYLIFPNIQIFAALLALEFPVFYVFDYFKPNTLEAVTTMKLDEFNGWHYYVVPPPKVIRGKTLEGVIIDFQLGLLKQIQGTLVILERRCI
jgi:hypothetical protein